ncbi:hypothetical protein KDL01_31870 [Actinospica durhamensis]|uniref:MarR family transcriptional regulator n=1 Tax=Actinospica durhamensis TaxID=1508375 RepID=A0A941IQP6_9ACTN|nr:hypothetical protein [Actinospica durhamensis]MBR7837915.1 hypothetical protein [Actinospica durhamensis]
MSERAVTGIRDGVDAILDQWRDQCPDLSAGPLRVITRLARVRIHLETASAAVFDGYARTPADVQALVTPRCADRPYRMGQARLMQALGFTSATVSLRLARPARLDWLARHEERGIVAREPDPDDKRSATIHHTDRGLSDDDPGSGPLATHIHLLTPAQQACIATGDPITHANDPAMRTPKDLDACPAAKVRLLRGNERAGSTVHRPPAREAA